MHIFSFNADLIKVKRSVYKDHDPAILDFSSWCIYYKVSGCKRLFLIQQWNKQNQKKHVEDDSKVRFFLLNLIIWVVQHTEKNVVPLPEYNSALNLVLKKICIVYRVDMNMNEVREQHQKWICFSTPCIESFQIIHVLYSATPCSIA